MIKDKKQMYIVIGAFALVLLLGGVTYAFFNYTRTGTVNIIKTGKMSFNSEQGTAINLTNMFPIDVSSGIPNDNTKVGTLTINITGDTTYDNGIEYKVSAVNVSNSVGNKTLPISLDVSVANNTTNDPATTLGTSDEDYFDNRGGNNSIYKVLAKDVISNNQELLVGYIAKGATGVDGNIVIRAYLDDSKILISDTYNNGNTPTDSLGTPASMGEGKTVFTTTEWNSLQEDGASFQIKVEANGGIWVEEIRSVNAMGSISASSEIMDKKWNITEIYFNKMGPTSMQNAYDAATIKADLTYNNEGKVLAWLESDPLDNTKYILYIASDGDTYLTVGERLFNGWASATRKIEFNNINTSRLTSMASMFNACSSLTSIDLSKFNTTNVTDMSQMFSSCSSLTNIDISGLNTNNVTTMSGMFMSCGELLSVNLSNLGSNNLNNIGGMFTGDTKLANINMSGFNFGTASLSGFLSGSIGLTTIDLSDVNISNVTNTSMMFAGSTSLTTIYVSNTWNTDSITTSGGMFGGCTSIVGGNGTAYDDSKLDKEYARIDTSNTPGYLTLKTN